MQVISVSLISYLQCWNGKDAGKYTNSIVSDGLVHQEYNPEVPIDLTRFPADAQINQQMRMGQNQEKYFLCRTKSL